MIYYKVNNSLVVSTEKCGDEVHVTMTNAQNGRRNTIVTFNSDGTMSRYTLDADWASAAGIQIDRSSKIYLT